jgi:hypothetical protein
MKHDRYMKQVELEIEVSGGEEGGQAVARATCPRRLSQSDLDKMAKVQRKVQCVLWFAKFESVTPVRREYRRVFNKEPPYENRFVVGIDS